ncbi:hypothetical protein BH09VER1_BH09VER1_41340 [soil metagenome]
MTHPALPGREVPENNRFSARPTGFTLIELLVAMAVFAILVVMLMGMVDSASKLWRQSENRMDSYRESRAALNIMNRDLRNALASQNPNYIKLNADAFQYLSDGEKNTNFAGAIFFLAAEPQNSQSSGNKSDVCLVGYFLAYGNTSMIPGPLATSSMNLYRYFLASDAAFAKLNNSTNAPFDSGLTTSDPNVELLARNIKSFKVTGLDGNSVPYTVTGTAPLPSIVNIEMVALNKDAAKILTSKDAWTNTPPALTNVVLQNSQTFSTRTRLQNKP